MILRGFDISLDLSRSALNRILEASVRTGGRRFSFSEHWDKPGGDDTPAFALRYTLELLDPWTRGGEEQRAAAVTTDWRLLAYARGAVELGLSYEGEAL